MDHPGTNRALVGISAALCVVGGLALGGLVSPLASGYLLSQSVGDTTITRTTSPLVEVRYVHGGEQLVLRGEPPVLWLGRGCDAPPPPCLPEPGRA